MTLSRASVVILLAALCGTSGGDEIHRRVKIIQPEYVRHVHHHHTKNVHHVEKVPDPYPVEVIKEVPVPVKVKVKEPYPVYVPKPYPVQVEKKVHVPVPVPVEKPVPVLLEKKVPVPIGVPVGKPVPIPVKEYVPIKVPVYVPVKNDVSQINNGHQTTDLNSHYDY